MKKLLVHCPELDDHISPCTGRTHYYTLFPRFIYALSLSVITSTPLNNPLSPFYDCRVFFSGALLVF